MVLSSGFRSINLLYGSIPAFSGFSVTVNAKSFFAHFRNFRICRCPYWYLSARYMVPGGMQQQKKRDGVRCLTGSPEVWREWIQNRLERIWFHYTRNETADIEALTAEIRPVLEQYGTADQKARFFSGSVLMVFRRDRYVISKE